MKSYNHKEIEQKWQKRWEVQELYKTPDTAKGKENLYMLVEYPYPSGNLHVGHWYAFAVPDIFVRHRRMSGDNVMYPIGFDSFGLPAENAAIKNNLDPKKWTYDNIDYMTNQLCSMGNAFDWSRKVVTSDPEYYKWTQWLFLQFYKNNLAYKKTSTVPWCDKCKTVLANEQIVSGACERCDTEVIQKELDQWFFKITKYADRLIDDLAELDWPEEIKDAQREWIGRSTGAQLSFDTSEGDQVDVFTTRPDTLFGATYLVLSPEHKYVEAWKNSIKNWDEVDSYVKQTATKKELERKEAKEKTGVELQGVYAVNPATKEQIPIWIADYVLSSYGTGSIMAVPAHDERDFAFAEKYDLPIRQVIIPCADDSTNPPKEGFEEVERETVIVFLKNKTNGKYALLDWHGTLEGTTTGIMGGIEKGQTPEETVHAEVEEEAGLKDIHITKKLRWITGARYCASHKKQNRFNIAHAYLAEIDDVQGQGEISELEKEKHSLVWVDEKDVLKRLIPDHQREVWQLLQKEDAVSGNGILINSGKFDGKDSREVKEDITKEVGGKETQQYRLRDWLLSRQRYWGCPIPMVYDPEGNPHEVPEEHLPWTLPTDVDFTPTGEAPLASSKELKERTEKIFGKGWTPEVDTMDTFVDSSWYFLRYVDPGNEKEFMSKEKEKLWMPVQKYSGGAEHTTMHVLYSRFFQKALFDLDLVKDKEPYVRRTNRSLILGPDGAKMSKSKGNVIDPDEQVAHVGADAVKMYLAFVGPYNEVSQYPWDPNGLVGVRRFLERVWELGEHLEDKEENDEETKLLLHQTVKKVGEDIEKFKFNTAISQMMILVNLLEKKKSIAKDTFSTFLTLLAPFAPHLTEELWEKIGEKESIHLQSWPKFDEAVLASAKVTIAVQINGKTRGTVVVSPDILDEEVLEKVKQQAFVGKYIDGKSIVKEIVVPKRLVSIVVK